MRTDRPSLARPLLAILVALAVLVGFAAFAGACTSGPATTAVPSPVPSPVTSPITTAAPDPTPIPTATPVRSIPLVSISPVPGTGGIVPQGILDAVLADAASRTGVPVADITVVTTKAVTWPNGALGCPQPGSAYTDMIVSGYQVVVEADGKRLDYRVGSGGTPILCENPPGPG